MHVPARRPCSMAATLELVGERWSLVVVRELFSGARRFDAVQRATGAPRTVLATRLGALEEAGVVARRPCGERPRRYEYSLTAAGRDLVPVLLTLQRWGDEHLGVQATVPLRHDHPHAADHRLRPELICTTCGEVVAADHVRLGSADPQTTSAG